MCKGDCGGLELPLNRLLEPFLGSVVNGLEVAPELLGSWALEIKVEESILLARLDKALHFSLILVEKFVKGNCLQLGRTNVFVLNRARRAARGSHFGNLELKECLSVLLKVVV